MCGFEIIDIDWRFWLRWVVLGAVSKILALNLEENRIATSKQNSTVASATEVRILKFMIFSNSDSGDKGAGGVSVSEYLN